MKNVSVILLFIFSLLSLGMALEFRKAVEPLTLSVERQAPKPAADAGSRRGKQGEDDSDEEDEEDVRAHL